jgi:DNA-directed RNA polymerase I subunit RPA2
VKLGYSLNGVKNYLDNRVMGGIPIMVKSNLCHLHGLSPAELVERHEEAEELGGYFIVNGIERLIRLLIVNRRNHVRPCHSIF